MTIDDLITADTPMDVRLQRANQKFAAAIEKRLAAERAMVSAQEASRKWVLPIGTILRASYRGVFPGTVARWVDGLGWRFDATADHQTILDLMASDRFWMPNVAENIADITHKWVQVVQTRSRPEQGWSPREVLLDWGWKARPDPLRTTPQQFASWCAFSDGKPEKVENRYRLVSEWYTVVEASGFSHSSPHTGTRLTVIATDPREIENYLSESWGER